PYIAGMPHRVLIVDDDPDCLESLRLYLSLRGFEVSCAGTAAQAIAVLAEKSPRVVITDLRLPDQGGDLVALSARKAGAIIIALSGETPEHGRFDASLRKPCSPQIIVEAMAALMAPPAPADG